MGTFRLHVVFLYIVVVNSRLVAFCDYVHLLHVPLQGFASVLCSEQTSKPLCSLNESPLHLSLFDSTPKGASGPSSWEASFFLDATPCKKTYSPTQREAEKGSNEKVVRIEFCPGTKHVLLSSQPCESETHHLRPPKLDVVENAPSQNHSQVETTASLMPGKSSQHSQFAAPSLRFDRFLELSWRDAHHLDAQLYSELKPATPVTWSEPLQYGSIGLLPMQMITAFDFKVCNASLGGSTSSFSLVHVVSSSPCLGLPDYLFRSLMSWLPVICPGPNDAKANDTYHCYVGSSPAPANLPLLSFRLIPSVAMSEPKLRPLNPKPGYASHYDPANHLWNDNSTLYIALTDLILERGELCVDCLTDTPDHGYGPATYRDYHLGGLNQTNATSHEAIPVHYVKLGTIVSPQFVFLLDHIHSTIGLRQKSPVPASYSAQETCRPKAVCKGDQTFIAEHNLCKDPVCDKWYFKSLDLEKRRCIYPQTLVASALASLFFLVVLELHAVYQRYHQLRSARHRSLRGPS